MRYKNRERYLWNPVSKKIFKNLPEERVRLRLTDYLLRQAGWSKNRISFELPVRLVRKAVPHRTDLVCYDKKVQPVLLVECKAENKKLSDKVATQIARYAQHVRTPWWLVTNGKQDFWFKLHVKAQPERLHHIPDVFSISSAGNVQQEDRLSYWNNRAFTGDLKNAECSREVIKLLQKYFIEYKSDVEFLDFKSSPLGFDVSHYYYLFTSDPSEKLPGYHVAFTLLQTPENKTTGLIVVSNNGVNKGLMAVEIDKLGQSHYNNAQLFTRELHRSFNVNSRLPDSLKSQQYSTLFGTLPQTLFNIFTQFV